MSAIFATLRLRPTRIGLLVRPTDGAAVRKIMRYCSCLWGGAFNPIIPVSRVQPAAWKGAFSRRNGLAVARGYVTYFEPDVFVEATAGLATAAGVQSTALDIDAKRVIRLDEFVRANGDGAGNFAFGLNLFELYRHLYEREFQFATRRERRIVQVRSGASDSAFADAAFGVFPKDKKLSYIEQAFREVFEPEELVLTPATLSRIFQESLRTPLHFADHGLKANFTSMGDPTLFVFDPRSTIDIIDLWNLRQFHQSVWPIDVE